MGSEEYCSLQTTEDFSEQTLQIKERYSKTLKKPTYLSKVT